MLKAYLDILSLRFLLQDLFCRRQIIMPRKHQRLELSVAFTSCYVEVIRQAWCRLDMYLTERSGLCDLWLSNPPQRLPALGLCPRRRKSGLRSSARSHPRCRRFLLTLRFSA